MTDTTQPDDFRSQATEWVRGNRYEDFTIGRVFKHHWGRTITDADSILFTTLTLGYNPIYFNADYAQAHGHERLVVNPLLVFNTVFGLTVEDLSEGGGPFLGVDAQQVDEPAVAANLTADDPEATDQQRRVGLTPVLEVGFKRHM